MMNSNKSKHCFLLFSFLLFLSIPAVAQQQAQRMVSYTYDNAGNRIVRKIVILETAFSNGQKGEKTPAPTEEKLGDRTLKIYPNPTKGALAVEISGGNEKDEIQIQLFNAQGVQLQNTKSPVGKTPMDMTAYPSGWYILRVMDGERKTEFKIIKQ